MQNSMKLTLSENTPSLIIEISAHVWFLIRPLEALKDPFIANLSMLFGVRAELAVKLVKVSVHGKGKYLC